MTSLKRILQVTGEAGAGKTTTCSYLAEQYDCVITVSDIIREFARTKNLVLGSRKEYLSTHRRMKDELGVDIVARTILEQPSDRICVDGIRVVNDVDRLRKVGSRLVALRCPLGIRFQRTIGRKSTLDRLILAEFIEDDLADAYNPDLECPNTQAAMDMADYRIDSSQPKELVFRAIDEIVKPFLESSSVMR